MNTLVIFVACLVIASAIPVPDDLKNAKDKKVVIAEPQEASLKSTEEATEANFKIASSPVQIRPIPLRIAKPTLQLEEDTTFLPTEAELNAEKGIVSTKEDKVAATSEQSVPKPIRGQRASTTTLPTIAVA